MINKLKNKKIFKSFNLKKFFFVNKINVLLILLLILLSIIPFAYSRYESNISSNANIDVAMYVLEPGYQYVDLKLADVLPSTDSYEYSFTVANYKDEDTMTDVNLEYSLDVVTTTNLPITYELVDPTDFNRNLIISNNVLPDDDGTYFRTIKTENHTFTYTQRKIYNYKLILHYSTDDITHIYQGMTDSIRIIINSNQILG